MERRRNGWKRRMKMEDDPGKVIDIKETNPEDVQDFTIPMVLIGSDVSALYPNLDAEQVAEIVYKAVRDSKIKWENIDYLEATRYIALNWDNIRCRTSTLRRVLPRRRHTGGSRPGMTGAGPAGPDRGDQEQWIFPKVRLTTSEKKEIIAQVVKIITLTMFNTHMYKFGGKVFNQSKGGPIGLRSTCSVARLVMKVWDDKWLERLNKLMIRIEAATRYMDDGRTAIHPFHQGWRWSNLDQTVQYCDKWKEEDKNISKTEVTKRILLGTMTGIDSFLEFTMETGEDFDGWLPSLDTNLAVEKNNTIIYKFFEKPMSANTVLHARTAMAEDAKIRCLANDLTRRMLTTSEKVPDGVRRQIIDEYAQKLLNSGYSLEVTRRIVVAGLKGYERKLFNSRKPGGKKILRTAKESYKGRVKKKMMANTSWFKKRPREEEDDMDLDGNSGKKSRLDDNLPGGWPSTAGHKPRVPLGNENLPKGWKSQKRKEENMPDGGKTIKTRSTLFIVGSRHGNLARKLREIMERMKKIVNFNVKIVERTGQKLRNSLSNNDPWKGAECGRSECTTCKQADELKLDCRKRSLIYENV